MQQDRDITSCMSVVQGTSGGETVKRPLGVTFTWRKHDKKVLQGALEIQCLSSLVKRKLP